MIPSGDNVGAGCKLSFKTELCVWLEIRRCTNSTELPGCIQVTPPL